MPGIYLMAGLTIICIAILSIATLNLLTHTDRRYYWLVVAAIPFSFIVNKLVKIPVITGIGALAGIPLQLGPQMPFWFVFVIWLAAPIFEEFIKVAPLALPTCRVFRIGVPQALYAGLAPGLGFGIGEVVYLAYGIGQSPTYNQLPWHLFTGFASERLVISFGHGLMTSVAALGIQSGGRKAALGYLTAVGLHALINLGPILMAYKVLPEIPTNVVTYIALLAAFVIFQHNMRIARKTSESRSEPGEKIYFER